MGVKRTLIGHCEMSAYDPKRTSAESPRLIAPGILMQAMLDRACRKLIERKFKRIAHDNVCTVVPSRMGMARSC